MGALKKYVPPAFKIGGKLLIEDAKVKKMIKHKDKYSYEERYENAIKIMKMVANVLHVEFRIKGIENCPKENVALCVNHKSFFDPFISQILPMKTVWIAKKEIRKFPVVGNIAASIDTIFLDRENPRDALRVNKEAIEVLKSGKSLWISNEGTRSRNKDHSMNEFKPGALRPAYETHSTILPMVICGSWKALDPKCNEKPIYVDVVFLKPIP